jgi:hypothetical protein
MRSELSPQGCQSTDGQAFELYRFTVTSPGTYDVLVSSTAFDSYVELRDANGRRIAVDGIRDAANNAYFKVFLPVGVYTVIVTSVNHEASGQFDIAYRWLAPTNVGCLNEFIVRDVQIERDVAYTQCGYDTPNSDHFRIYMAAGSEISAVLEDQSLSQNYFELQDESGDVLVSAVVKDYIESDIRFVAPADGFYVLNVRTEGGYTLTVR